MSFDLLFLGIEFCVSLLRGVNADVWLDEHDGVICLFVLRRVPH